jgi:hypothetical protein
MWDGVRRLRRKVASFVSAQGDPVYFLWIGKTGGNSIRNVLQHVGARQVRYSFEVCSHDVTVAMIPPGHGYFFSIRHPVDRFVSGFYSRCRQGKPKNNSPWNRGEAAAFQVFPNANSLAEALSSSNSGVRMDAEKAFSSIMHVKNHLVSWFDGPDFLNQRPPLRILRQSHLDRDLENFLASCLGLRMPQIPKDPVARHQSPVKPEPLSDVAVLNLSRWYRADLIMYEKLLDFSEKNGHFS